MKKIIYLLISFSCIVNAQVLFDPLYNLSNTPSATSDYHSVYSQYNEFYVAWGDNGQVLLKTSYDFGQTWSSNKLVTSDGSYPVIAALGQEIVIAYHDLNTGVFVQKSTNTGNSWWAAPLQLSTHSSAITPQLSNEGINLYAVWEERPGSIYELMFSRSTNFGTTWSAPVNISNTTTTSRWAQIKSTGNTVYCTWVETTTYPFSDIYFSKSTDAGTTWSTPVNITNDNRPQNRIYMYVTPSGEIYLACDDITSYPVFNRDDIYLIKSTNGGSTWSTAVNITNNPGHSNTPCIVVVEPNIYFTWADNTGSAPNYDNSDIYFKKSPDGGLTWDDSIKICSNPESSSRPRICWGWDGPIPAPWISMTIVWYDYSTGDAEILARNGKHFIPVELTSFTGVAENNNVNIYWSTATETNNKGFELERRISDSESWNSIAFIEGKGTTTQPQKYFYSDKNLDRLKYHYRLRQIDFDGTGYYSDEIEVDLTLLAEFSLTQNFPNPFNPVTTIKYNIAEACFVSLEVYNALGVLVKNLGNEYKQPGEYQINLNASDLPSGVYMYQLKAGNFISTKKMSLIK
jgi:hypothetical protein